VRHAAVLGLALVLLAGCAAQRADRLFAVGDDAAAIAAYEALLARRAGLTRGDASRLLNLAVAYSRAESPSHDAERAAAVLDRLIVEFPQSVPARQAELMREALAARRQASDLEREVARRDEQLARLRAVLDSVAQAEQRLRSEVESKDEATLDLESKVNALTGKARRLTEEITALQDELEAIKRIDLESATRGADPP
jgi:chromosome segregation ATPase